MQVIGQINNIEYITNCIKNNNLPKFIIINGQVGSGKKTIAKYIANTIKCPYVEYSNKIEDIRNLIDLCYTQTQPIIYCITDGENLSLNAKNALLKIAEEPPKFATIILTTTGEGMIDTIKSRGITINTEPYTRHQLEVFLKNTYINLSQKEIESILLLSQNIGECIELQSINIEEIFNTVNLILNNINKASIGNCLKLTSKFALKDETTGINIKYFLRAFQYILVDLIKTSSLTTATKYYTIATQVLNASRQLSSGYNKTSILDELFLGIKGEF